MTSMNNPDIEYFNLVKTVLEKGIVKSDRTGIGTISYPFPPQMRFDLSNNKIPLLTTKKMHVKSIIHELLWFLKGDTNVKYLQDNGVRIWNEWCDSNGDLGEIYGASWRRWPGKPKLTLDYTNIPIKAINAAEPIDQIENIINLIKNDPTSRRIIVNAWNPTFLPEPNKSFEWNVAQGNAALPPCHAMFQFWCDPDKKELTCHLYQRSVDVFLGCGFNIAQYAMLTHMIAQVTGYTAKEFVHTGGDVHIYTNHIDQIHLQLKREPYEPPTLKLNPKITNIDDFKYEDFEIVNYNHHPAIKGNVAV